MPPLRVLCVSLGDVLSESGGLGIGGTEVDAAYRRAWSEDVDERLTLERHHFIREPHSFLWTTLTLIHRVIVDGLSNQVRQSV